MKEKLVFKIRKNMPAKQGESIRIPHPFEKLFMKVDMPEKLQTLCYVVIKDTKGKIRLQKLLGHGETNLVIGKSGLETTIGGVPGVIEAGEWSVTLYFYMNQMNQYLNESEIISIDFFYGDEGIAAKEVIGEVLWEDCYHPNQIYREEKGWYKGDFHTHTRLSDGKETTENATKKAIRMGMDFYVPTEHNTVHTGWRKTDLMIVPGVEITTEYGHCNLFGIDKMPESIFNVWEHMGDTQKALAEADLQFSVDEAIGHGWLVSINHPFLYIWKWLYQDLSLHQVDCLEIINDPTYEYAREANDKTIEFLYVLWNAGYHITGIGGSDSHNLIEERYRGATEPSVPGDPATYVYCEKLSPADLLSGVKKGCVYVSRYCEVEMKIQGEDKEYLPGEEIIFEQEEEEVILSYRVSIHNLTKTPVVYLIENGKKKKLHVTKQDDFFEAYAVRRVENGVYTWLACEIRDEEGRFLAFINPVYAGEKTVDIQTFGEAVSRLETERLEDEDQGDFI